MPSTAALQAYGRAAQRQAVTAAWLHACCSRPLAPRASLSLERFAAALCTLLQQWIRAAGSRRRAARWRWLCLVLPPACFRPGREASWETPQVLSRVAQPPSGARRALDRFSGVTILPSAWPETLKESVQRAQPAAHLVPRRGQRCAAGYARCTDYLNVSGQAEGSIVTPQNLSRARLAALGGCATLDRTCGAPAAA